MTQPEPGDPVNIVKQHQLGGNKVALVAGATGLVGRELIRSLLLSGPHEWQLVYGVARKPPEDEDIAETDDYTNSSKYRFVQCDLLDREEVREKMGPLSGRVSHLFWATWASHFPLDTTECCAQNRVMLSNVLDALLFSPDNTAATTNININPPPAGMALRHVCLQTGTKHYISLKAPGIRGPYLEEEEQGCDPDVNFYHTLERLLMEQARKGTVMSWSVHRPGVLFGASSQSYFNTLGSLCVYATLCRQTGKPFLFYGTRFCWEEHYIDMSDARLVAAQQIWWASSSHPLGHREAFNAVSSAPFVWKEIWPALADKFGIRNKSPLLEGADCWLSEEHSYTEIMRSRDMVDAWEEIVSANGLRKRKMEELANWGLLDSLFRIPGKMLAAPGKDKSLGFMPPLACGNADSNTEAVLYWVDRIREMHLIP